MSDRNAPLISLKLTVRADLRIEVEGADALLVLCPPRRIHLKRLSPDVLAALMRLSDAPMTREELVAGLSGANATASMDRVNLELDRLASRGLIDHVLEIGGIRALSATFSRGALVREQLTVDPTTFYQLSRFSSLALGEDTLVVDALLTGVRISVETPSVGSLLAALARPTQVAALQQSVPTLTRQYVDAIVGCLSSWGAVVPSREDGGQRQDRTDIPRELHDVLFHARTRGGMGSQKLGATYRYLDQLAPAPAIRPPFDGRCVVLPYADIDELGANDPSFTEVLEARRSIRNYDVIPLTIELLGEFLFRVARVRHQIPASAELPYESTSRPYPSGGACYDLEFYLVAGACDGLARAIYHYDPREHILREVCNRPDLVEGFLRDAWIASGRASFPQVLIVLASRFARVSWKYEGIAYAVTLKNVGVLYAMMYLVATAMGLAPCALGGGDSARFASATGLDPYVESSVGEFMLGVPKGGRASLP